MKADESQTQRRENLRKRLALAAVLIGSGAAIVILTIELASEARFTFLTANRDRIIAAEVASFGILAIEMLGRAIRRHFRRRDALQLGMAVRNGLRAAGYVILGITIISLLSANPAVALGVGGVAGIIVAFAVQNIVGNILAGTFLALGPLFKVGDRVTVSGNTGDVVEIGLVYTLIDAGDKWVFIPSSMMMTTAVQRLKDNTPEDAAQSRHSSAVGPSAEPPGPATGCPSTNRSKGA